MVLTESNAELRQLLFLEKAHSANLLQQLANALENQEQNHLRTSEPMVAQPTPRESEVLNLFESNNSITSKTVCDALHYKTMQVGSSMLLRMERKGLVRKIAFGKNTAYAKTKAAKKKYKEQEQALRNYA